MPLKTKIAVQCSKNLVYTFCISLLKKKLDMLPEIWWSDQIRFVHGIRNFLEWNILRSTSFLKKKNQPGKKKSWPLWNEIISPLKTSAPIVADGGATEYEADEQMRALTTKTDIQKSFQYHVEREKNWNDYCCALYFN